MSLKQELEPFFNPRSVAIVGASESPDNMGRCIAKNMQEFTFNGMTYLVGPRGGVAFGRRIYRSVADIPDQLDLAVLLVPARFILEVLRDCGEKGIKHVIIETAGFSEYSGEGAELAAQVSALAAHYGIRFIGPNCIGVMNMHNGLVVPFVQMKNIFSKGKVSIITQSGGVSISYLNVLGSENIGLSKFVSIGNKLNVNECDLLEYLIEDDETDMIVMYLEGISDGRRLMRLARSTSKPILMHKSNTGSLAKEIAQSHTASLSGDDKVVSAALKQCGVARFNTPDTLVNYLKMLPLPRLKGNRLAIVSRSGGHAVIAADACERVGFKLAHFPRKFLAAVEKHFRASVIKLTSPLDLGDLFDYEVYSRIVEKTLKLDEVDAVVFLHTYLSATEGANSRSLFKRIEELSFEHNKPATVCIATDSSELSKLRQDLPHPIYTEPEDVIRSLALVRDFNHQAQPAAAVPPGHLDRATIDTILARCREERRSPLMHEAMAIIRAAGIRTSDLHIAASRDEAMSIAAAIEGPKAVKLVASKASHKSDLGGVVLNCRTADDVAAAFDQIASLAKRLGGDEPLRVGIQAMVNCRREIIVGSRRDQLFGPVVLFGVGGIFVEVFQDAVMRVAPFDEAEAEKMMRELKAYPLLAGIRGQPPRDLPALKEAILSIARLVEAYPMPDQLDINPLMAMEDGQGCIAVDARMVLRFDEE